MLVSIEVERFRMFWPGVYLLLAIAIFGLILLILSGFHQCAADWPRVASFVFSYFHPLRLDHVLIPSRPQPRAASAASTRKSARPSHVCRYQHIRRWYWLAAPSGARRQCTRWCG